MKRHIFSLLAVAALSASAICAAAPQGAYKIVPGHSVGQISLGPDGSKSLSHLPKATAGDAGMMQTEQVWTANAHGRHDTLFIHTVSNDALNVKPTNGVTIDTIRVTSPQFRTPEGIGRNSTLAQILYKYPDAHPIDSTRTIFDDTTKGIAFEFPKPAKSSTECIAVTVHTPGKQNVPSAAAIAEILKDDRL